MSGWSRRSVGGAATASTLARRAPERVGSVSAPAPIVRGRLPRGPARMLTLLLSAHDGGTCWRHLLAPGEARAGFEPVGPLGLARRVGRILGIPAEPADPPDRLAAWTQRLDQHDDGTRSY